MKILGLYLGIWTTLNVGLVHGGNPNPVGSTGCHFGSSWQSNSRDGSCWRYCSGSSGDWCYTARDCKSNKCYAQDNCSGQQCPSDDPGCRYTCKFSGGPAPDPAKCASAKNSFLTACEGSLARLHCVDRTTRIKVITADYGRSQSGLVICPRQGQDNASCVTSQASTTERVAQLCDGTYQCEFDPVNLYFQDPCEGVYKYLQVQYTCQEQS